MRSLFPEEPQAAIAAKVEMTPDAFSRALNGSRSFSTEELVRIAAVLKTSLHWLATGEQDPFAVSVAARHQFDSESRRHVSEAWEEKRALVEELALPYQQLGSDIALLPQGAPVPRTAAEARVQLKEVAGEDFVRTLAGAVEAAFGIGVVRTRGVDRGFSLRTLGRGAIVVNETGNWFYQNWSIAHELGHFAHDDMKDLCEVDVTASASESGANAYAADLLMPADVIESVNWSQPDLRSVAGLIWHLGVSTDALLNRLAYLRVPVPSSVLASLQQPTQRFLRRYGSDAIRGEITPRMEDASTRRFPRGLLEAHAMLVDRGQLLPATLAWMLGVEITDLVELAPPNSEDVDPGWLSEQLGVTASTSS